MERNTVEMNDAKTVGEGKPSGDAGEKRLKQLLIGLVGTIVALSMAVAIVVAVNSNGRGGGYSSNNQNNSSNHGDSGSGSGESDGDGTGENGGAGDSGGSGDGWDDWADEPIAIVNDYGAVSETSESERKKAEECLMLEGYVAMASCSFGTYGEATELETYLNVQSEVIRSLIEDNNLITAAHVIKDRSLLLASKGRCMLALDLIDNGNFGVFADGPLAVIYDGAYNTSDICNDDERKIKWKKMLDEMTADTGWGE